MTLINRVSAFFLLALAASLIGYSAVIYGLIREHLFHQFDGQITSSLNVLVAAVEVESDGVKWQPSDHTITLGNEREDEEVRWIIVNEQGQLVDCSDNLRMPTPVDQELLQLAQQPHEMSTKFQEFNQWRYLQYRLTCPEPKPISERDEDESAELFVTVARDAEHFHTELWRLGLLTSLLPIGLWGGAAVAGRAYCRRALRPVGAMAARARSMTNADFDLRLPVSQQQDELSSLATAFNSLLDRLQEAYLQQQRFTGDAAHQLRTPLTVLRGEIDVALRRPRGEEEHRNILKLLSEQTDELQQIVETLLFLARTAEDGQMPDARAIPLATWLPDYFSHWKGHARFQDLSLQLETNSQLHASDSLLRQALDNLISNALKYSPAGSPVTVHASTNGQSVVISVEDRGSGIAPSEREAIFAPFYRSAMARQAGVSGTGLGLAIVARIAQALGGTVQCDPATPQGSRFTIRLPLAAIKE